MHVPIWVISLLFLLFGIGFIIRDFRRFQALRDSPTEHDRRILAVERWKYVGGVILFGCTIPLSIALIRDAPDEVVRAILAVGGAGFAIVAVASFLSGWMRN
jgi:hypothetical protein